MSNKQTKEFLSLQKEWDKKLADSGFSDIEDRESGKLKVFDSLHFTVCSKNREAYDASKREYYRLAGQFLHDHEFSSEEERLIWSLHSEGLGTRHITKTLENPDLPYGSLLYREKIEKIIRRLRALMLFKARTPTYD